MFASCTIIRWHMMAVSFGTQVSWAQYALAAVKVAFTLGANSR